MCPDAPNVRTVNNNVALDKLLKLINLIDKDAMNMCITGGEPTLLKSELFTLLSHCKRTLPHTNFMMLTNGRMFCYKKYALHYHNSRPEKMLTAVAVYGHTAHLHDSITNEKGSFNQTINGLMNLYSLNERLEIRIVVSKLNYKELLNICKMIVSLFPNIYRVNIMGLEMLGNAVINKEAVWIDFDELKEYVQDAIMYLLKNGIQAYLYNFPLCKIDEKLWSVCIKSISDYKVRYFDDCSDCDVMSHCGGFFNSTIRMKDIRVNPIRCEV